MTMEERLGCLERQNQRMKKGLIALTLAMASAMIMGQVISSPIPNVIRARKFEVVNGKGNTMVELGSTRLFGYLFVSNQQGKVIATVSTNHSGDGMIRTLDSEGRPLIVLSSKKNGESFIATFKRGEEKKP